MTQPQKLLLCTLVSVELHTLRQTDMPPHHKPRLPTVCGGETDMAMASKQCICSSFRAT